MKSKLRLLASASIVLMMAGGAAFAQEAAQAPAAASTDQTAADKEKAKDKDDSTVIVVKGYRASLRSAQQIKRRSDSIIDAVVAEDIGKLPDVNAAESLARLPGVQITHGSDEGSGVLVRGLPDVATTVNGRDISTAELRRVQMQDFPSGALAGMEVYKSGTADLLEPGLAGLINVRTRRPFDFKGFEIDGAIRETYNDQNGKYNTNGNVLITDRWNTGAGEMGALLNLSYTEQDFRNAVRWATGYIANSTADPSLPRYPDQVGVYMDTGHRWRPSANATLQWRPNDQTELYADFLWQAYRAEHWNDWAMAPLWSGTKTNVVMQEGTNQIASMTNTGGDPIQFYRSTGFDRTDTQQIAVGGSWNIV
jgi:TonB-dependent receptor